ncbi:AT-rich interactive domain-containing protein 1-like [Arachis duranensis]|uniref:AT-rich interactive domain-containing protein 1-like n=1 Tax=Arachis duranensis TaxID=130453 RepID=A0A9C6WSR6_ARADU|nr:AT-rich interactive domain-containing protein 1-like [Arachis duranensis]
MTTTKKIHGGNYVNLVSSSSSESSDEEDKEVSNQEYLHDLDVDTTVCVLNQFILDDSILAEYGRKEGGDSSDDEIQVLKEFDVEDKKCGGCDGNDNDRKGDNNSMELLSWVKNVAVNSYGESKVGLTCNNKNPEKKKVLSYREAASNKKRFRSSREQQFWKSQKMCPSLYEEEPKDGMYNLRKKLKKNNNERFSSKRSTFSIRTSSNASLDPQNQEEKKEDKEKKHTAKKMSNNSKQKSFFDRHVRVKHVPIGPRHQVMVPEWNGGGGIASLESDSKWLGTRIWPLKDGMNPRVMIERDPIGKGRQDSCGCLARGLVDCVGFHVAQKRTKLKLELGRAFYELDLDKPRTDMRKLLSEEEEEE